MRPNSSKPLRLLIILATFLASLLLAPAAVAAGPQLLLPYAGKAASAQKSGAMSRATPVRFNAAQVLGMGAQGEVTFTTPGARTHTFVFDLVQSHGEGITSWVGKHKTLGAAHRAIVTTGAHGTFASISTPDGEFRVTPGAGHDWLVDMTAEQAHLPLTMLGARHELTPPAEAKSALRSPAAPETMVLMPGFNSVAVPKATPTPQYVVDIMFVYTQGLAERLGTNLMTRLHFLVTRANTSFADSEVAITLRLVNAMRVNYSDTIEDTSALEAITPGTASFDAAAFGNVESVRNAYGADMVALVRDGASFGGNGAAQVGTSTPAANAMYSVTTGCVMACEWIFIHQLGHNLGSKHDRANTAFEAGGTATYPQGAYPYSYGHYSCAGGNLTCNPQLPNGSAGACPIGVRPECATATGSWATIMALFNNSSEKVYKFSNPALSCNATGGSALPCGVASGSSSADDARSMNNNRAAVSALKATVVPANRPGSVQFNATAYAVAENAGSIALSVGRIGGSGGAIQVQYATSNGTATAGSDYTTTSGTLSWGDGDTANKTITVPIANNAATEGNESFTVTLSNPGGATGVFIGHPASATVTILEPFPAGGTMPSGFTTGGQGGAWTVASDRAYEGSQSLRSGQALAAEGQPGGLNSDLNYTANFQAGTVSFAYGVSSFVNAGTFQFIVDGSVVFTDTGAFGWKLFTAPLAAGTHTLTWRFSNSLSAATPCNSNQWNPPPPDGANCADRAWIDALALPANQGTGLDPNADQDNDGVPNGVEPGEGLNPMVKDNDIFTSARLFPMQQYRDFLGREGDADGITFYQTRIANGSMTRLQTIENFLGSAEFQNGLPQCTRLYFSFFNRIPDYGGLMFQVGQFRSGVPLDVISQNFSNSPEFTNRYGSLTNGQYVDLVYQNVLGRPADPQGRQFYVSRLDSGEFTRGQVMIGFSESPEFQQIVLNEVYVTAVYVGMLRRAPDPGGMDFYVNLIEGGAPRNSIINGFMGSPEYRSRFMP